jgi:tripartite-type tricarboxylate transporter receptor subunit TctC
MPYAKAQWAARTVDDMHLIKTLALAAALLSLLCGIASAQEWPVRPVRMIVPFPPGQGADIVARVVAEPLTAALGKQVIVDNRPGAGSLIGSALAAKSAPDGYTYLVGGNSALAINMHVYRNLSYDTLRDFAPVTNMIEVAMVFCVNPLVPATDARQLIALAKKQPNQLSFGSSGNGSISHLSQALFAAMAGIDLRQVPYKGSVPNLTDLIAGQTNITAETNSAVAPYVAAGKLRAIAVSPNTRIPFLPEVGTLHEQGVRGYDVRGWTGLVAPAGTPNAILDRMNRELVKILHTPEMKNRLYDLAIVPVGSTREQFTAHLKSEIAKWGEAVRISGATIE